MAVNKVILLGNLGKDPIIRKTESGRVVAQFTIATSEKYKDKTGNLVTNTEWHNIVAWSPLAEIAEKFLKKGSQVYIEGKITSRDYTDKDGQQKRFTEILAREFSLVDRAPSSGGNFEVPPPVEPAYMSNAGSSTKASVPEQIVSSGEEDDLPF
jgi:single-strand DNA-binding protein